MAAVRLGEAAAQNQSAPLGTWLTERRDSHIEIYRCNEALCGRIAWMKEPRDETGNLLRDVNTPDPALRYLPLSTSRS